MQWLETCLGGDCCVRAGHRFSCERKRWQLFGEEASQGTPILRRLQRMTSCGDPKGGPLLDPPTKEPFEGKPKKKGKLGKRCGAATSGCSGWWGAMGSGPWVKQHHIPRARLRCPHTPPSLPAMPHPKAKIGDSLFYDLPRMRLDGGARAFRRRWGYELTPPPTLVEEENEDDPYDLPANHEEDSLSYTETRSLRDDYLFSSSQGRTIFFEP
ncbi:hypothetical protein E2C01_048112 [Portunus trituberculatus]|uniref:Uncharacterized protein n=1 Tax=Portunus trituberculatus TaxID=210409 RepID=A0A5B7GCC9_PORTR|nr:hypothetical protein [Portunus trituberculatus]